MVGPKRLTTVKKEKSSLQLVRNRVVDDGEEGGGGRRPKGLGWFLFSDF